MRKFSTLMLLLCMTAGLFAAQRTVEDAAAIAAGFSNAQSQQSNGMRRAPRKASDMRLSYQVAKPNSTDPALFVFNKPEGGWVIVSADDNAVDVLGYSNEGSFDGAKALSNTKWWLKYYAERVAYDAEQTNKESARRASARKAAPAKSPIAPLLDDIEWNQGSPYNDLCPIDPADGTRCYTGCVATAAVQIMRYWKWPATGEGRMSYDWKSAAGGFGHEEVDFSTATYDWDNTLPNYEKEGVVATQAQKQAVALVNYHTGVATQMGYGGVESGGSGSFTWRMGEAMNEHFRYTRGTYHLNDWGDTINGNANLAAMYDVDLEAGRPILMGGGGEGFGGHDFVCDGRDGNGFYHINWGWGGGSNGYYSLAYMEPWGKGTTHSFSEDVDCVLGLEPLRNPINVNSIALSTTSLNLKVKELAQLETIFTPSNASNKGAYWTSSDENVATVSRDGVVTGVAEGTAIITATSNNGNKTATCEVNVANEYATTALTFDYVFECKWDSAKSRFSIGLENGANNEYPYLWFRIRKSDNTTLAGYYELGGDNEIYGWVDANKPNYVTSSRSGWLNITYISNSTYKFEGIFYGNGGEEYTFNYTTRLNMKGATLADQPNSNTLYTATFMSMGEFFTTTIAQNGQLKLPVNKPLSCNEMTFIGWCKQANYNSNVAPTLAREGEAVNGNTTYYAVFANPDGGSAPYQEVASLTFKSSATEDGGWYDPGYGFHMIGNLIESSNNITITDGAWLRAGYNGLKLGDSSTNHKREPGDDGYVQQAYITFGLNQGATITKVVVTSYQTQNSDNGRLQVDLNGLHTQNPIVYGENIEYIPSKPTHANSLTLATTRKRAYIKSLTLYTGGGESCTNYTTTTCQALPTEYAINIAATEGGYVETNLTEAEAGEVVTISTYADEGYELSAISVVDANNQPINVLNNSAFIMPASEVTVSATFEAIPQGYTEVASIVFRKMTDREEWYDPGYGFNAINNLVESSNNITITDGGWLRPGAKGIRIGGNKYDKYKHDTDNRRSSYNQGFITLSLDENATITKVVVNCAKTNSHDNGKVQIEFNGGSAHQISFGTEVEYIPSSPVSAGTITLSTSRRAAYIRSVTLYTGGDSNHPYYAPGNGKSLQSAETEEAIKMIENGQVYIIRGNEKYNILGQKIQ